MACKGCDVIGCECRRVPCTRPGCCNDPGSLDANGNVIPVPPVLYGEDRDIAGLHAAADAAFERDVAKYTAGALVCKGCDCQRYRCQPLWRHGRKCCPDCNHQPTYPLNLKPWELEPHYSMHVADMTAEALHGKSDIALQLAWRDKRIADLVAENLKLIEELAAEKRKNQPKRRLVVSCASCGVEHGLPHLPSCAFMQTIR